MGNLPARVAFAALLTLAVAGGGCATTAPEEIGPRDAAADVTPDAGAPDTSSGKRWSTDCGPKIGGSRELCRDDGGALPPVPPAPSTPTCKELQVHDGEPCEGAGICFSTAVWGSDCRVYDIYLRCIAPPSIGCPTSTARVKKHIEYLTAAEVSEAAREIRDLPLVRYRYKSQGDGVTPTVGIVIEDVPGASFVDRENQRVNLYSFVSSTAAAYQAQAKELDELKARLAAVEARCGDVEAAKTPPAGQAAPSEKRLELRR
jgi:hypothetical protein